MRILSLAAVAALTLGVTLSGTSAAFAQSDEAMQGKQVFGYQDARSGVFHPLEKVAPDVTAAPTTGTIEVTFTITLKTAVPTGGFVICDTTVVASSTSLTTGVSSGYTETAYALAKVTGTTATCTVNTPYSWVLPAASSTNSVLVIGDYSARIVPPSSTTITAASFEGRSSSSTFLNSKAIPATGSISKYTVNVTL